MATATKPWQAQEGVWEKLFWLLWRFWPKKTKTPQKTYNQQEGNNQHNTACLHSETSVQLTGVEIPTTGEQHSLYFQLRQQLQHNIYQRNPRPGAKLKHWGVILPCSNREARLARRFWLCWVVSPVTRFLIAPSPPVQGPEVQDTKQDFTGLPSRQTLLCWLVFSTRRHTVMLNQFALAWALLQNSSGFKWA